MRIVPPDWRGLYFLAFFNSDTALNWICNEQAKWIAEFETGRAALPTKGRNARGDRRAPGRLAKNFEVTPRHGIEVEHLPYFDDLKKSLKACQRRARERDKINQPTCRPPPSPSRYGRLGSIARKSTRDGWFRLTSGLRSVSSMLNVRSTTC